MVDEEKQLNPKPSDTSEATTEKADTPKAETSDEMGASQETVEASAIDESTVEVSEKKLSEKKSSVNVTEKIFSKEVITSGPYSEEIRVVSLDDLEEQKEKSYDDQVKIYESSLKDVSQEQRVIGKVVAIHEDEILMDVGFKSEGVVAKDEFEQGEIPKIGEQIEVFVDVLEDENGQMILSKRKADFMRIWERVREIHNNKETIEGRIVSRIKGGMVVDIMGIDAFLPGSQIDIRPVIDFDSYVGKAYDFRVVKLNELRKNIVLSRKMILEEDMKEKRQDLLSKIKVGDILKGRVKNITDFGVFIDLGGLDGLLHITDLSWGRVNHPKEIVNMDEELTVKVIDYDPERQRVSLGLKQLTPHPWEGVEQKYPVDSIIKGKVVNITNYGVFVELERGVEGLIHISEISWIKHIKHPSEIFSLKEVVEAKVLSIDSEERKISLGYKQLEPDPWESIEQTYKVGSFHKGIVRNLTPYGAFVELQGGIDGFVHISDLSWTRKLHHPREVLRRGDETEIKVLEISRENRKIALGIKQVVEDPWPLIEETYTEGAIVEGEVLKITDKIIVVKLEYGLEGIVPLSQIPRQDRKNVAEKIKIGEKMQLKVLEVSKNEKRLVLSQEQAIPKKPKSDAEAYMMKQKKATDKLEIPEAVIKKISKSEKAKKEPEIKKIAKKRLKPEKVEKEEMKLSEKEEKAAKPKKKTTIKKAKEEKEIESKSKPAVKKVVKRTTKRETKPKKSQKEDVKIPKGKPEKEKKVTKPKRSVTKKTEKKTTQKRTTKVSKSKSDSSIKMKEKPSAKKESSTEGK